MGTVLQFQLSLGHKEKLARWALDQGGLELGAAHQLLSIPGEFTELFGIQGVVLGLYE